MAAQRPAPTVRIARSGLTIAVAIALATVFAERGWLIAAVLVAIAPHALMEWSERRDLGMLATIGLLVAGAFVLTLYIVEPHTTTNGIPTASTFDTYFDDLSDAPHVLRTAIVPVTASGSALLLSLLALFVAGTASEWAARRLDAPLGAVAPSLVLFVAVAALGEDSWVFVTIVFALAVALYLLALHNDDVRERRSWFTTTTPHRSRVLAGGAAGALGVVLAAALLAPILPGAASEPWFDYRSIGDGDGGGLLRATTPIVSIQAKLLNDPEHEVFTVDIGDSQPAYWRVIALDSYDGSLWTLDDSGESADDLSPPPEPRRLDELVQQFRILDSEPHWLPAAYHPIEINLENALVVDESATIYVKPDDQLVDFEYEVTSAIPVLDDEERLAAPAVDPDEFERYLELPDDFPDTVAALATEITEGTTSPWAQADAIENYLNSDGNFVYNDRVARSHSIDTLEEFLFDAREGYCEQFASAFAAMARSVGLPTRVAVGYSYGTRESGVWHVRNKDAHAWPEVYFTGLGWVALEPTPGRGANVAGGTGDPTVRPPAETDESEDEPADSTTTTIAGGSTPTSTPGVSPGLDPDISLGEAGGEAARDTSSVGQFFVGLAYVLAAVAVLAAIGVVVLVVLAMRRTHRRRHAPDPRDRVLGAWAQAVDHLGEAGVEPRPSATATEFALRYAPAHGAGEAGPPLMDLAQLQTQALFAPSTPSDDDVVRAWGYVSLVDAALRRTTSRGQRWRRRLDPRRFAPSSAT